MSTRIGSLSGAVIDVAVLAIERRAGRFEARRAPRSTIAIRAVAIGAEQDVDAIGNQVVVRSAARHRSCEGREIEVLLRAAAGACRSRDAGGRRRMPRRRPQLRPAAAAASRQHEPIPGHPHPHLHQRKVRVRRRSRGSRRAESPGTRSTRTCPLIASPPRHRDDNDAINASRATTPARQHRMRHGG